MKSRIAVRIALLGLLAGIVLGVAPCPPPPVAPPFDAAGSYEGEWWSGEGVHCPLAAEVTMNPAPVYPPLWAPQATFTVDFSCLDLPPEVPPLAPIDIATAGLMDDKGVLTFASGGCGTPFCVIFSTTGNGADADADDLMDDYAGTWALTILLAGFQPFGFAGDFDLGRVETPEALSAGSID